MLREQIFAIKKTRLSICEYCYSERKYEKMFTNVICCDIRGHKSIYLPEICEQSDDLLLQQLKHH